MVRRDSPSFPIPRPFCHSGILTEYVYIGPDYQHTVTLEVSPHINLRMFASVLHIRGGQVTKQPHVGPTSGDIFCWNGEVCFVFLLALDNDSGPVMQVFEGMEVGRNLSQCTKILTNTNIDQL